MDNRASNTRVTTVMTSTHVGVQRPGGHICTARIHKATNLNHLRQLQHCQLSSEHDHGEPQSPLVAAKSPHTHLCSPLLTCSSILIPPPFLFIPKIFLLPCSPCLAALGIKESWRWASLGYGLIIKLNTAGLQTSCADTVRRLRQGN